MLAKTNKINDLTKTAHAARPKQKNRKKV